MISLLRWAAFVVVTAALIHVGAVHFLPIYIVSTAHSRVTATQGVNTIVHSPRIDETARQVVRPSPDLLYSLCAFDLTDGPVRFTAPVPEGTYASLSFFNIDSTNFFAANDRTVDKSRFDLTLVTDGTQAPSGSESRTLVAPGPKGIALFRTLITDESAFERLDAMRREAACVRVR